MLRIFRKRTYGVATRWAAKRYLMGAVMAGQRVLVVEDDPALRELLHTLLLDEGYEARTSTDGAEALSLLENWRPELILLDLMMPGLDGWQFRHVQQADPRLAGIPVVVMSAAYTLDVEAEKLGVAAMVPKPYDFDELLPLVERLLS
jgi:CheY-like chemotaxis protein